MAERRRRRRWRRGRRTGARLLLASLACLAAGPVAAADGDIDGLPPGQNRELVRDTCGACHSLMLVRQQRLSRRVWSETLDWMIAEQGMARPTAADRAGILDYLSDALGQDVPR